MEGYAKVNFLENEANYDKIVFNIFYLFFSYRITTFPFAP